MRVIAIYDYRRFVRFTREADALNTNRTSVMCVDIEMEVSEIRGTLMEYKLPLTTVTKLSENCQREALYIEAW